MPGAPPNKGVFDFGKVVEIIQRENLNPLLIRFIDPFRKRTCPPFRGQEHPRLLLIPKRNIAEFSRKPVSAPRASRCRPPAQ
jgi:hypothetical protein